ncbi:DedA family protein [Nonomuraea sp. NPDC048916]|uniref:DedA family protein n=1 Tax=Nonomuraea sp. NPDC048916 TaxID=3154232 RepID=UPI0033E50C4B
MLKPDDVEKAEDWFARHGHRTVFLGRMVPVFRSVISVPAGLQRMSPAAFSLLTALGSLIWNTVLVLAGYLLGEQWPLVRTYVGGVTNVVIVLAVLALLVFAGRRIAESRRN